MGAAAALRGGDLLMLYNGVAQRFVNGSSAEQFDTSFGWAVLNGSEPSAVLHRGERALLTPDLP